MELSELTPGETAILLASLESLFDKKFNCNDCLSRYKNTERGRERSVNYRRKMGCFDYTSRTYQLEDFKFYSCIGNFQDTSVRYYWELFQKYQQNMLPYRGSLQEQPNKIIEIFNFIEAILKRKQDKAKGKDKKELTEADLEREVAKLKSKQNKVKKRG